MIGCAVFPSLVLIFFGVLFFLENLGVADGLVSRYWPVILIVLGVSSLFNLRRWRVWFSRFPRGWPPDGDRR
jgi:hypothetical protein